MTKKERKDFLQMYAALRQIAKGFMTPGQLRARSLKMYGLEYPEALEGAYENILESAKTGIAGVTAPKSQNGDICRPTKK